MHLDPEEYGCELDEVWLNILQTYEDTDMYKELVAVFGVMLAINENEKKGRPPYSFMKRQE